MEYQNKTLKDIRVNALQFSQEEMAKRLNLSLTEYINIEESELKLDILLQLSHSVGLPIDEMLSISKRTLEFSILDKWTTIDEIKHGLALFLQNQDSTIKKVNDQNFVSQLYELEHIVNKIARKPKVAFVGKSDVGKSTLINSLIGTKTLPEAWTPTTSIIIYVKHTCDKPAYLDSDEDVYVFKTDNDQTIWEPSMLENEEYTKSLCITQGGYSLLSEYGARTNGKILHSEAMSAVVFIDAPILKNCDIIDLPGYGTGDRQEDDSLLRRIKGVDILVYLSLANGFLRGDDILWVQNELPNLNTLPVDIPEINPLDNLFIVASQAHTVSNGSIEELSRILDKGAERFNSTLPKGYWNNVGMNVSIDDFRSRFFTYSTNQEQLCHDFDATLQKILELLPEVIASRIAKTIQIHISSSMKEIENRVLSFRSIITARDKKMAIIEEIEKDRTNSIRTIESQKHHVKRLIDESKIQKIKDFTTECNSIITIDNIKEIIAQKKFRNKEDDIKLLVATIANSITSKHQEIVRSFNSQYRSDLNQFFERYDEATQFLKLDEDLANPSFSSKKHFLKAVNDLAEQNLELGANKAWAIEEMPYIEMPLTGLTTVLSFVSAAGAFSSSFFYVPVINIAAMALGLAALLIQFILSINWEKRVAKMIIEEYENKHVLFEYQKSFTNYCDSTHIAFSKGTSTVDVAAEQFLTTTKDSINSFDESTITENINSEELKITLFKQLLSSLK